MILSEHRLFNFSVIPIVFHWKCEIKCILVKKWGNQNKSYEAVENAVILGIWRCFTYRMELNRKWCVWYDNSLLSNLDYIEKHRSNKTNILIAHYKSFELEFVFSCILIQISSFDSPLLSDRLYLSDKNPSVFMLHVEIYGTQACCPWFKRVSSTSWTSPTVLS